MPVGHEDESDFPDVDRLYHEFGDGLWRFLVGILRDPALADDVLQTTFAKAIERGHTAKKDKLKGWLYRVAYNEAMLVRRRDATGGRILRQASWSRETESPASDHSLVQDETIQRVRREIENLPIELQQIVRMRIYEEKTFAVIAQELQIPLGTALGRMRSAMSRLKKTLDE